GPFGEDFAAHPGLVDLVVEFADERVLVGGVAAFGLGLVAAGLGLGSAGDPPLLEAGRWFRVEDGFVVEVPAFAALRGAEGPGSFGARRAHGGEGVPARDEHLIYRAGHGVGAAELDRADACAVLDRDVPDHLAGQGHREPFGPGRPATGNA